MSVKAVVGAVVLAGMVAAPSASAASSTRSHPTKPAVAHFAASPARLSDRGGRVTLTARVARASLCELDGAGIHGRFACAGTVSKVLLFPADTKRTPDRYTFTLTAFGSHGRAASSTQVMVAGVPARHRPPPRTPPVTAPTPPISVPSPPVTPPGTDPSPPVTPPVTYPSPPVTPAPPPTAPTGYVTILHPVTPIPYTGGTVYLTGSVSGPVTDVPWLMQIGGPPALFIETSDPCAWSTGTYCSFADEVRLPAEPLGAIYTFALYPWVSAGNSGTPAVVSIVQEREEG